jgi:hypothetical protein
MRNPTSVETLSRVSRSAELGTHLHGEFAPPGNFEPDVTRAFQRDYSPEVEGAKLEWLTNAFRSAFGRSPRSFRAGRFGIGPNSLPILERLGYEVESSVTPFINWEGAGARGLDFRGAPTQPYYPDRRRPHVTGNSPVLEVPVTIRRRLVNRIPLLGPRVDCRWLRPSRESGKSLVRLARAEIRDARTRSPDRPIVLNAMLHNVEVIPGASPYASTPGDATRILKRLAELLAFARRESIRVVGLGDVPAVLNLA